MRSLIATFVTLAALALGGRDARADNVSQHERAKVTPWVEGGKVVGLRLSLTLRPNDTSKPVARVSLGPNTYTYASQGDHRAVASDPKKGYLVHQWPQIKFKAAELGKPQPMTFEVRFKDAPKLAALAGKKIEVISTWNDGKGSYWHVYGLQGIQSDPASVITVPTPSPSRARTTVARTTTPKVTTPAKPRATTARTATAPKPRTTARATARTTTARATRPRAGRTVARPSR